MFDCRGYYFLPLGFCPFVKIWPERSVIFSFFSEFALAFTFGTSENLSVLVGNSGKRRMPTALLPPFPFMFKSVCYRQFFLFPYVPPQMVPLPFCVGTPSLNSPPWTFFFPTGQCRGGPCGWGPVFLFFVPPPPQNPHTETAPIITFFTNKRHRGAHWVFSLFSCFCMDIASLFLPLKSFGSTYSQLGCWWPSHLFLSMFSLNPIFKLGNAPPPFLLPVFFVIPPTVFFFSSKGKPVFFSNGSRFSWPPRHVTFPLRSPLLMGPPNDRSRC